MIVDVMLKGRRAYWVGEETEIFVAPSHDALINESVHEEAEWGEILGWKVWWTYCLNEIDADSPQGKPVLRDGERLNHLTLFPLICNAYGDSEEVAVISSQYW